MLRELGEGGLGELGKRSRGGGRRHDGEEDAGEGQGARGELKAKRGSSRGVSLQQIALATHHCALVLTQKRWDHRQVCCDTTESNHTQPRCSGIGQSEVGSL